MNTASGNFWHTFDDLAIPGRGPALSLSRTYNSLDAARDGWFGRGWASTYETSLAVSGSTATVMRSNGSRVTFEDDAGTWVAPPRAASTLVENVDGTWTFRCRAQDTYTFDSTGRLTSIEDRNGYETTLAYPSGSSVVVTDAASRTLTFTFTGSHVTSVADSATPSRSLTYTYDGSGDLADVVDVGGGHWQFTYDGSHRMLTMRSPKYFGDTTTTPSPVVTNHYDGTGRVDWQSDELGRTTSLDYTTVPGSTIVTDPEGSKVRYTYTHGILTEEERGYGVAGSSIWKYEFDPVSTATTKVTDPNDQVWTATYDANGNRLSATDPLERTWEATYNAFNQPLTVTDGEGITTTMTYDGDGNLLTRSTPWVEGPPSTDQETTYAYEDGSHPGDVTSVTDAAGEVWEFTYTDAGDVATATDPDGDVTLHCFDEMGRRLATVSPRGTADSVDCETTAPAAFTTYFTPDEFDRVISAVDPLGQETEWSYDPDGLLESTTDANGHMTGYEYDPAGQLLETHRADASVLAFDYFEDGRLHHRYDGAENATTHTYDSQGRLATVTDPLGRVTSYGYDPAGNRTTIEQDGGDCTADPKTRCISFVFDEANQLTDVDYSDTGTPDLTDVGYDDNGRRVTMTDGTGSTTFTWDSLGRLIESTTAEGTVGYGWDLRGLLTEIDYPDSAGTVTRTYTDAGQLETVADWLSNTSTFSYDADGNLVEQANPNGTTMTAGFDEVGMVDSISHAPAGTPGQPFAFFGYSRDDIGQLTSVTSTGVPADDHAWGYTELDQLESDTARPFDFDHDPADNLIRLGDGTVQHFDEANQLCWMGPAGSSGTCASPPGGATAFDYDSRGNRVAATPAGGLAAVYGYDQVNRLTSVSGNTTLTKTASSDSPVLDSDGFTRANGSLGVSAGGEPWQVDQGSWAIDANKAKATTNGGGTWQNGANTATLDSGTADGEVTANLTLSSSEVNAGVVFRLADSAHYLKAVVYNANGTVAPRLQLWKRDGTSGGGVGSGYTQLGSDVTSGIPALGTTATMTVRMDGPSLKVFFDGQQVHSYTLSGGDQTTFGTNTRHGIGATYSNSNDDGATRWNNYRTRALATDPDTDDFTRANGGLGMSSDGEAWQVEQGSWAIDANKAKATTNGGGTWQNGANTATLDSGTADGEITANITFSGTKVNAGLVFRAADAAHYLKAVVYNANGTVAPRLQLWKRDGTSGGVGSGYTQLGSDVTSGIPALGATATMTVRMDGPVVTVLFNGQQVHSYTLSGGDQTTFGANTRHGIGATYSNSNDDGATRWNNYRAGPAPTGADADDFTRANGSLGISAGGEPWRVEQGSWAIDANKAKATTNGGGSWQNGLHSATLESGFADGEVSANLTLSSSKVNAGLILRSADAAHHLKVVVYNANGTVAPRLQLWKRDGTSGGGVGSGYTQLGSDVTSGIPALGATATLTVRMDGPDLTVFINGQQVHSYTLSGGDQTLYGSNTRHGIGATYSNTNDDGATRWNTYQAVPLTTTYTYNGDGLRAIKTTGTTDTTFTWDHASGLPLLLAETTGSDTSYYVYGPGGQIIEKIDDSTVLTYHHDQLGSVRALTDDTGDVVATYSYDAYGNPTGSTGSVANPFGFAGEYRDAESSLIYLRARYYDSMTGQFLTRDPLESLTREPYGYVGGNPLNGTDPSGLYWGEGLVEVGTEIIRDPWAAASDGAKGAANFGIGFTNAAFGTDFQGYCGAGQSWSRNIGSVTFFIEATLATGLGGAASAEGQAGVQGITGYTRHGLNQAISKDGVGVAPSAILDAVRSPLKILPDAVRGTTKFVGGNAVVVLNDAGRVVTTWARSAAGWRL